MSRAEGCAPRRSQGLQRTTCSQVTPWLQRRDRGAGHGPTARQRWGVEGRRGPSRSSRRCDRASVRPPTGRGDARSRTSDRGSTGQRREQWWWQGQSGRAGGGQPSTHAGSSGGCASRPWQRPLGEGGGRVPYPARPYLLVWWGGVGSGRCWEMPRRTTALTVAEVPSARNERCGRCIATPRYRRRKSRGRAHGAGGRLPLASHRERDAQAVAGKEAAGDGQRGARRARGVRRPASSAELDPLAPLRWRAPPPRRRRWRGVCRGRRRAVRVPQPAAMGTAEKSRPGRPTGHVS